MNKTSAIQVIKEPSQIETNLLDVVGNYGSYIHCYKVYFAYFRAIPSVKTVYNVNYKKAVAWVEGNLASQVIGKHIHEEYNSDKKRMESDNIIYVLAGRIIIDIEDDGLVTILFTSESENEAQNLAQSFITLIKRNIRKTHISVISNEGSGLNLVDIKNKKPKLDLKENYNDDLYELHDYIIKNLKLKDKSGLYLFHGEPGTGKSTYIRHLIHCINKRVFFLSPRIAGMLDSPEIINLLIENPNAIVVVEDAEDLLISRESRGDISSLSAVLNLTDGILGESLNIQIICTFNTRLGNIDSALLRKGRLKALYEFKALSQEKAKVLLEKLGNNDYKVTQPMTLADIFQVKEQDFFLQSNKKKGIGFGA